MEKPPGFFRRALYLISVLVADAAFVLLLFIWILQNFGWPEIVWFHPIHVLLAFVAFIILNYFVFRHHERLWKGPEREVSFDDSKYT
jgi:hypothetical protein